METLNLAQVVRSFEAFKAAAGVGTIVTEADYNRALALIDAIFNEAGDSSILENPDHPLSNLLDWITLAVREYEAEHYPIPPSSPRDALRFLMEQHDLKQSDLPEVGSQSVISEILSGRRLLTARQIAVLAGRFKVSADLFIESVGAAH